MSQRNLHEQVDMGVVVSQYPIDLYKASKNKKDLITLLSPKPIIIKSQFHENIGFSFHSLDAATQKGLMIKTHYAFLIVVWNTDAAGTRILDKQYKLQVLKVANEGYGRLVNKFNLIGNLTQHLLQISCEGEEKFQSLIYEQAGKSPHLLEQALFNQIQADMNQVWQYIPLVCASDIDDKTFLEYWAEGVAASKTEQVNVTEQDARDFSSANVQLGAAPSQNQPALGQGAPQMNAGGGAPQMNAGGPASVGGQASAGVVQNFDNRDFNTPANAGGQNIQDVTAIEDNAPQMNAGAVGGAPQMDAGPANQPGVINAPANPDLANPDLANPNLANPNLANAEPADLANAGPANAGPVDQSKNYFNRGQDFNFNEKTEQ